MTLAEIRAAYPDPSVAGGKSTDCGYCVGGAFCLAAGGCYHFPNIHPLAEQFEETLGIEHDDALVYARIITESNDTGDFEAAWAALGDALDQAAQP